ncbi:LPS-assembly protein LptD [Bartonella sp. B30(2025)]
MKSLKNKQITILFTLALKSVIGSILSVCFLGYVFAQNLIQNPKRPLFLSADELVYNHDANTVSAKGNVRIEYDGNKAVAQKVTYNPKTGRIIAQGNVEIIQKNGNKIRSNYIDMTKDFGEGFVQSLYVDTVNNIHFSAVKATRSHNQITVFHNATYTACNTFSYKQDNNALWKIKAKKIIWNNTTKKIQFENSRLEFFDIPILKLSTFELYDPTVKRTSGLLMPHFFYADYLGIGIKNSYFLNLAPHYDFTLSTTIYTQQGLLTEGEWRQRLKTGNYNIRFAHIYQTKPHNFDDNTIDAQQTNRYMLATKGDFRINSRWTYGWDILAQSDKDFSRTYKLENYDNLIQTSQLYLNGFANKNYFDMRFYNFKLQDKILNSSHNKHRFQQAWVLPRIDYFFTPNASVYTGLLTFHSNIQSIYRRHTNFNSIDWNDHSINMTQLSNVVKNSFRLTNELEWKKRFNTNSGLILTPTLALRTDLIATNAPTNHTTIQNDPFSTIRKATIRSMGTAGLELQYPLFINFNNSAHIIEPTIQVFMRNNEQYIGQVPNEDAQSFLFDTTTLFQRNKFSGYDRAEGGTRANIGLRYSGSINKDWSLNALVGQSFHLAGKNSFAEKDLMNISNYSGLEKARSDYVAMLNANHKSGFSLEFRGRFNQKTGEIRHSEIEASQKWKNFWASTQYAYTPSQLNHEYTQDRKEISFQTGIKFANDWSIDGNAGYDLVSGTFVKRGINFSYTDECFELKFGYQQVVNPGKTKHLQNFNFSFSLLTI